MREQLAFILCLMTSLAGSIDAQAEERSSAAVVQTDLAFADFQGFCLELVGQPERLRAAAKSLRWKQAPMSTANQFFTDEEGGDVWLFRSPTGRHALMLSAAGAGCGVHVEPISNARAIELADKLHSVTLDDETEGIIRRRLLRAEYGGVVGLLILELSASETIPAGTILFTPLPYIEGRDPTMAKRIRLAH